ncbi:MAG: hypothetical protein V2A74_09315 [bacterium]
MGIIIRTAEELNKLIDSLEQELHHADSYHRLICGILAEIKDYEREYNEFPVFWPLVFRALHDGRLIRLCRAYDQQRSSLSLVNLLRAIKGNRVLFREEHFRKRYTDERFVDFLAQIDRIPSDADLETDIQFASEANPVVKKLILWRNNAVAHRGTKATLADMAELGDNPISRSEIDGLLDGGYRILNHYSNLFRASGWSRGIVGDDDYKALLKFIRLGLEKYDENIQTEDQ